MGILGKLGGAGRDGPDSVFTGLRSMVLGLHAADLGIDDEHAPPIFGVVMETGHRHGSATLACLADGTVSLYTSAGGGVIGSGDHDSVRSASRKLLSWTNQYALQFIEACRPVTEYPLPGRGAVFFYLLTTHGVRLARCSEGRLLAERDPFSNLFKMCNVVQTAIRETSGPGA